MTDEVFVIPRDAESVSANSIPDSSYILVMRQGQSPVKVLIGDTGVKNKLTISETAPQNPKAKDRWINSNLKEFVFLTGEWRPVGGYVAPDPVYLTASEYQALVNEGAVDPSTEYNIFE